MSPRSTDYALLSQDVYHDTAINKTVELDGITYRVIDAAESKPMAHDGRPPAPPTVPASLASGCARSSSPPRATRSTRYVPDASSLASPYRLARRLAQVAVPGLFLSLAACGGNMEEPKAQLNPNPKLKYALEIVLQDSPGPFDKLSALAQFDVVNATCVPEQPISGARITPRKRIPIDLSERKDGVYEGTFSLDAVLDANYHGLGVCHWTLTTVNISSEKGGTSFVINLTEEDIQSSRIEKRYFSRESYDHPTSGFIDDGGTERVRVKHPETTFSMEAIARRVTP